MNLERDLARQQKKLRTMKKVGIVGLLLIFRLLMMLMKR